MDQTINQTGEHDSKRSSFVSRLLELGWRLLKTAAVFFIATTILLVLFANDLYFLYGTLISGFLPQGTQIMTVGPFLPVFTPLKLALITAVFIAMPFVMHQAACFIGAQLLKDRKRLLHSMIILASVLFYLGALFAYLIILPALFQSVTLFIPEGVTYSPDIVDIIAYVIKHTFAFGFVFAAPVMIYIFFREQTELYKPKV